jgi:hypothetical protein
MLFGITAIVLIIACANIANLLLARGAGRAMEMGVRLALGATRRQLLLQLLTESVLLAFMGGIASLIIAQWTLSLIASLLPPEAISTLRFELQPPVILFTAAVSLVTGILFGLFPALHSTRSDLVTSIRANAGSIQGHRGAARFRASLVTVQIALATGLLISAGLFLKSLVNVTHVDLGVNGGSGGHLRHLPRAERLRQRSFGGAVRPGRCGAQEFAGHHRGDGLSGTAPGGGQLGHRCGRPGFPLRPRRRQQFPLQ